MVNLLSPQAQRTLVSRYYARFMAACAFLAAAGVLSGAALLLPSYLLANGEADAAHRFLEASQQAVALGSQGGAPGIVAVLAERVGIMRTYAHPPATARILSAVTAGGSPGISITKITVTPSDAVKGQVELTGKAATRNALLSFVQKLQGRSLFSGVTLPVSDLATGTDVPFTLSFPYSLSTL
jgi:hypothetical protein